MITSNAKKLSWSLIWISIGITTYFLISISIDGYSIWGKGAVEFDKTGQVGDFIGGIIGTIFSGAGFYLLYLTLAEQRKSFAKERFESKFFDLIKLHRDNVNEFKYSFVEAGNNTASVGEGRKVFRIIFSEFKECLKEIRNYMNDDNVDLYITKKYKESLGKIFIAPDDKNNLYEVITIDIAYNVIFYGLSEDGQIILKRTFLRRYHSQFYSRLIKYLALKPRKQDDEYDLWKDFASLSSGQRRVIFEELYTTRFDESPNLSSREVEYYASLGSGIKYYGGHQHRLGHYFRHLFQSYKYLNNQTDLSDDEKYFYGKILRAQLSTYEQTMLFISSISSIGLKWELNPEYEIPKNYPDDKKSFLRSQHQLITKYQLIKNLPGKGFLDIRYKHYYPNIRYEFDEIESVS